jgi:geranylgeranyl diphosphate synthase, type I
MLSDTADRPDPAASSPSPVVRHPADRPVLLPPTAAGWAPEAPSEGTEEQVVLLADDGSPMGVAPKASVHTDRTPLHLAFSCYLFDRHGRVLLTRRALGKSTWPGVWTNTCCGHPAPGEDPRAAVRRRLRHELGVDAEGLRCVLPGFAYRAVDPSGLVENEICPVWLGRLAPGVAVTPDPTEVMDAVWVRWADLVTTASATPQLLSPWSVLQVQQLAASDVLEEEPA